MKCVGCGFEMPDDWPRVKLPEGEVVVCAPCLRRFEAGPGGDREGVMTP